jgi:tail tube GTA-gp10-like protein
MFDFGRRLRPFGIGHHSFFRDYRMQATVFGGTMANRHRGEIEADIGGARRRLVLTLGALAELEDAFGAEDLVALTERFGSGRLKARDLTRIIGAGLRGAGAVVTDDDVAVMAVEGGAQGYVRIAAELIRATFGEEGA